MHDGKINQQVDKISELLAFVVSYDPDTLVNLETWFGQIVRLANDTSQKDVSVVAEAALKVVQNIINDEENKLWDWIAMSNQDGGSILETGNEKILKNKIREQLLCELMESAVSSYNMIGKIKNHRERRQPELSAV